MCRHKTWQSAMDLEYRKIKNHPIIKPACSDSSLSLCFFEQKKKKKKKTKSLWDGHNINSLLPERLKLKGRVTIGPPLISYSLPNG